LKKEKKEFKSTQNDATLQNWEHEQNQAEEAMKVIQEKVAQQKRDMEAKRKAAEQAQMQK